MLLTLLLCACSPDRSAEHSDTTHAVTARQRAASPDIAATDSAATMRGAAVNDPGLRREMERFLAPLAAVYFGHGEWEVVPINDTTIEAFGVMAAMHYDRAAVERASNAEYYLIPETLADRRAIGTFGRAPARRGLDPWENRGGYSYHDGFYYIHRYDIDDDDADNYLAVVRSVAMLPDGRYSVLADVGAAPTGPGDSLSVELHITATVTRDASGHLRLVGYRARPITGSDGTAAG